MITGEAHIENEIEVNDNLSDAMAGIAEIMHESIIAGLEAGGNPTFHPLGSGAPSFLGGRSGSIANSLGHSSTDTSAEAGVFNLLPYSYIHQMGGQIKVTDKQRSFFRFMGATTGDRMWWAMLKIYKTGDFIQMPKREYVHFTDGLVEQIMEILKNQIFTLKQGGTVVN